jgi:hypothetical protein
MVPLIALMVLLQILAWVPVTLAVVPVTLAVVPVTLAVVPVTLAAVPVTLAAALLIPVVVRRVGNYVSASRMFGYLKSLGVVMMSLLCVLV